MLQTVQFNQPPPSIPNLSVPPPTPTHHFNSHRFHGERGGHRSHFFQPFRPYPRPGPSAGTDAEFDGKRLRKSVMRKTVDYNSAIIKMLENRVWQRDFRDRRALQPDVTYYPDLQPPPSYADNPINSVTTRFVKTATNKMRCPIFCMAWTPEGRRLVTGASSGEFTLWNGLTFNFETILQAHDSPVRTMVWSHNDVWMVTGDHSGFVKYWQSNMNNVKMFQAHKEAIRGLSFSPTDHKFVTCSDDGTLRIWDFMRCHEERILRGHGADVKCVHWHPQKGLIVSGSKDNQQPVKLWDPKSGQSLATLHAHKNTVMDIKWNDNGNWLVTASRDHLLKLFDLRNLSQEVQTFRGHKKEASSVAWHPYHEGLFTSGGSDGAILFWHVGADKEVGAIEQAHDSIVWTLAWHPLGHILCSGSNDHTSKFWTRNRPGDLMRDKYNLNTLPAGLPGIDDQDIDEPAVIPGMGLEDKVETEFSPQVATIPGLDFSDALEDRHKSFHKKVPYSKPIPRNFQAQWNETGRANNEEDEESDTDETWRGKDPISEVISQLIETSRPPGVIPLSQLKPQAIIVYGKLLPVEGNPALESAIAAGPEQLQRLINSGAVTELEDVMPHVDDDSCNDYDDDMELDTMSDIELPQPLPSSAFARKDRPRKSRFSDIDEANANQTRDGEGFSVEDRDMRTLSKIHNFPGQNMSSDQDMRFSSGDLDLRQFPQFPMGDHDFRNAEGDSDFRQMGHSMHRDEDMRSQNFMGSNSGDWDGRLGNNQDMHGKSHQQDQDFRPNKPGPPSLLSPHMLIRPNQGSPGHGNKMMNRGPNNLDMDIRKQAFSNNHGDNAGLEEGRNFGPPGGMMSREENWGSRGARKRWGESGPDGNNQSGPSNDLLGSGGMGGNFGRGGMRAHGNFASGGPNMNFGQGGDFGKEGGKSGGKFGSGRVGNFGSGRNSDRGFNHGSNYPPGGNLIGSGRNQGSNREDGNMQMGNDGEEDGGFDSSKEEEGSGVQWGNPFQGRGGPFRHSQDDGFRGRGGRGFSRGRGNFDHKHRGGVRGGSRGRYRSMRRGRGGRGADRGGQKQF